MVRFNSTKFERSPVPLPLTNVNFAIVKASSPPDIQLLTVACKVPILPRRLPSKSIVPSHTLGAPSLPSMQSAVITAGPSMLPLIAASAINEIVVTPFATTGGPEGVLLPTV